MRQLQAVSDQISLYGIRHHGPGSTRALLEAFAAGPPDLILIEGPPEMEPLLGLFVDPRVEPPVAILHYAADAPERSLHSPYTIFSPEWQAIKYALEREIPVGLIDLPIRHQLAMDDDDHSAGDTADPLSRFAEAAGFGDPERWWEHLIEQRGPDAAIFPALHEAMVALRSATTGECSLVEQCREAWMRREIRLAARASASRRIAVVCGAWHLPVLDPRDPTLPDDLADERLLARLPTVEVRSCWVPWTDRQLARTSGYGAGLGAPGWSRLLWERQGCDITVEWVARSASILRASGHEVPASALIEAVRLAFTLAAIRGLTRTGLTELRESIVATLCDGDLERYAPVQEQLVIGDRAGRLPDDVAAHPLLTDWQRQCRILRLRPQGSQTVVHLDLRQQLDLRRSRFFHQLDLLRIGWCQKVAPATMTGFRESWRLEWTSHAVSGLNSALMYGSTIESAAIAVVFRRLTLPRERRLKFIDITNLIDLFGRALLAGIGGARIDARSRRIDELIADQIEQLTFDQSDLRTLMEAFPVLVRLERYGGPHQFDPGALKAIVDRAVNRISIGITVSPLAVISGDAADPLALLDEVDRAMALVGRTDRAAIWSESLRELFTRKDPPVPGAVAGRVGLLLWHFGGISSDELSRAIERALVPDLPRSESVAWIEGLLRPSGSILAHDPRLLRVLDNWLAGLDESGFIALLPSLRRTFSRLPAADRRHIARSIGIGSDAVRNSAATDPPDALDPARSALTIRVLSRLLGLDCNQHGDPAL